MDIHEIAKIYEDVISKFFPSVIVRANDSLSTPTNPCLEAFMIPDNEGKEFTLFIVNKLPNLLEARKIPFWGIIPHDESSTRKFHSDRLK